MNVLKFVTSRVDFLNVPIPLEAQFVEKPDSESNSNNKATLNLHRSVSSMCFELLQC